MTKVFSLKKGFRLNSIRMKTLASILPAFLATLLVISVFSYNYSKSIIQEQLQEKMNVQLHSVSNQIFSYISVNGKVPEVLGHTIASQASTYTLEQYRTMLSEALQANPATFGIGIYFDPYQYDPEEKYFSTYAYRDGDKAVTTEEYSDPSYDYLNQEWYKIGKQRFGITDPYYDSVLNATLITFAEPFEAADGTFLGVITADVNLDMMQKQIEDTKVGKTGWAFLLDKQGTYIAGPDKDKIMKLKLSDEKNKSLASASSQLLGNEEGMVKYSDAEDTYQTYYSKLPGSNWVIALVIPEKELYQPLQSLLKFIMIISLAGLAIVVTVVIFYSRFITRNITRVNEVAQTMASGDFTRTLAVRSSDEFGTMANSFNQMIDNVRNLLSTVTENTLQVASTSEQLMASANQTNQTTETVVQAIQDLAAGADTQMQGAQESARAMEEMASGVQRIAEFSGSVAETAEQVNNQAQTGNETMNMAVGQMMTVEKSVTESVEIIHSLSVRSDQIGNIIGLITNISNQTNLLSLNAAIEAARAGEQGRGFAVVAGEVRKLSEQTSRAAQDITNLISEIQAETRLAVESMNANADKVHEGSRMVDQAGQLFAGILGSIKDINDQIQEISAVSQEISAGTEEVASTVDQLAKIASQAAYHSQGVAASSEEQLASMEEVAASSKELARMAEELENSIKQFRVK
jgi:methyl-accepting chemotaxis protein